MSHAPILVSGVSGHLGRRVVELLLEQHIGPIIATTRTPEKHVDLAALGVAVRAADFDDAESLSSAFAGAERMLLVSTGVVDGTGRRVLQHRNAIDAAKQVGVEHIVYTSFLKADDSPLAGIAADHAATEKMLEESGVGYTILRNAFYMEMVLGTLPPAIAGGRLASAAGEGRIAYVTREDCACAAAAALTDDFQGTRTFDITGPAAISAADLARIASGVLGVSISYVPVTGEDLHKAMVAAGVPDYMAALFAGIDRGVSHGAMDVDSNDFEKLTGRAATPLAEFLSAHKEVLLGAAR